MRAFAIIAALCLMASEAHAQRLPANSHQYRAALTKEARAVWGIEANIALFAAQIHQESTWRDNAMSQVGARGLAQFMPGTASDMNNWYAPQLRELPVYSPLWSIRALVLYNRRLYGMVRPMRSPGVSECDRIAMMLSGYNGGFGWVTRDRRLTSEQGDHPDIWFGSIERHSNRAAWAIHENRDYVQRIVFRHLPLYLDNGFPGQKVCSR
jgi:membrane-bound lytic murein transglycosylase MltF